MSRPVMRSDGRTIRAYRSLSSAARAMGRCKSSGERIAFAATHRVRYAGWWWRFLDADEIHQRALLGLPYDEETPHDGQPPPRSAPIRVRPEMRR